MNLKQKLTNQRESRICHTKAGLSKEIPRRYEIVFPINDTMHLNMVGGRIFSMRRNRIITQFDFPRAL